MFEVAFRFGSYAMLALFLAAALAGTLLLAWLLPRLRTPGRMAAVAGFFIANLSLLCTWAATIRVDSDEAEHLHAAWLVGQGLVPYRDFWQAHSPLLWYLLAPAVTRSHSPAVFVFSRALAAVLFLTIVAATAWLAWRVFGDRGTATMAALLVLALGVRVEAAWLRPDQLANLLVLLSLALAVPLVAGPRGGSRRSAFLAGAAFGVALSLTPKPFLTALAFPAALALAAVLHRRAPAPASPQSPVSSLLFYLMGGLAGVAPLFVLLWRYRIIHEWTVWTLLHHATRGHVESNFPAVVALMGLAGCVAVVYPSGDARPASPGALLIVVAFALQSLGCVLTPYRVAADLMLWLPLASVLAAPLLVAWVSRPSRRAALGAALVIVLIQIEAVAPLLTRRTLGNFASDRARMAWMIEQAGDRPVVLVTPVHTVFSRDATGLYHLWQYSHWSNDPLVAASLAGFAKSVLAARPALIAAAPRRITDDPESDAANRPRLFETLVGRGMLPPAEWQALEQFVQEKYVLRQVDGELFYVLKEQDPDRRR